MTLRLAVVASHPIQYQAPLFRLLADRGVVEPDVFFLSDHGVEPSYDPGMGQVVRFDVPLTEGYQHRFLANRSPWPSMDSVVGAVHPGLVAALKRGNYDAVLVLGYAQVSLWMANVAAGVLRIPLLLRGETQDPRLEDRSGPKWLLKRALLGALVKRSAGCLAIGRSNARFYFTMGARADQVFSAPYSVDDQAFRHGGAVGRDVRAERLEAVGLDPDRPVVMYSAKFLPRKRPLDVVDAVQRLRGRVQMVMAGDGELRPEIERVVAGDPSIRLLGFVNQTALAEWYGISDLFVLASDSETWGLVVNEAMAAGSVPIVSDAVGCAPDLVEGGAGRVFPVGDVAALASCLDELADPVVRRAAQELVRQRIERYSLLVTALGIERAVQTVGARREAG